MRILVASHGYPPVVSGVTIVAQKVARAMVARGHEVLVVTGSDRHDPYENEDAGCAHHARALAVQPLLDRGSDPLHRPG